MNKTFAALILVLLFGCYFSPKIPIDTIRYDAGEVTGPRLLFVFLPGNGDSISVFRKEGLVEAVRERGLRADMIAVNAHIGYYMNGSIFTRLKEDIIEPAKAGGYDQIWMIGNSLGGYGSILYASKYPNDVTGVVLLGPFLGEKEIIDEIKGAGGLKNWEPGNIQKQSKEAWENYFWLWIKERVQKEPSGKLPIDCVHQKACYPKIYLGYGQSDRFSSAQDFLASLLPPDHVIAIDGGHAWSTWKKVWSRFLDNNIFRQ